MLSDPGIGEDTAAPAALAAGPGARLEHRLRATAPPPHTPASHAATQRAIARLQGASWTNLTIIESAKCGGTCNPHAVWSPSASKLVVTFFSHVGIATLSTADPTGQSGWSKPVPLAPWLGPDWAKNGYPGPGIATALALPNGGDRLLFVAHVGPYLQDVRLTSHLSRSDVALPIR